MTSRVTQHIGDALFERPQSRRLGIIACAAWTLAILLSFGWNYFNMRSQIRNMAVVQARDMISKDLIFRRWNAQHGGVYVPVTNVTVPNPHLNIHEREIVTPSGRILTKVNPAYMIRQVHELAWRDHGIYSHITSLKPIRPGNAPDEWERKHLRAFEGGATEVWTVCDFNGTPHLRFMRPLLNERACLMCHAIQGYREGDIRGAISVAVPMKDFKAIFATEIIPITAGHGVLWAFGVVFIFFGVRRIARHERERDAIYRDLQEKEERYRTVADFTYDWEYWIGEDGRFRYLSPSCERISGYPPAAFIENPDLMRDVAHPDDRGLLKEHFDQRDANQVPAELEFRLITRDGETRWISHVCQPVYDTAGRYRGQRASNRDITDRKRVEESLRRSEERYRQHFENTSDIVFTIDDRHRLVDVSPSVEDLLGYGQAELMAAEPGDSGPGCIVARLGEECGTDRRAVLRKRDGEERVFDVKGAIVAGSGGEQHCFGIARDVTERESAEEQMRISLLEKEILLKEIHHRVKNNMQIISSLLNLQQNYITDERLRAVFIDSQNRVRSMAMIHENLYRSNDLSSISFHDYAHNLVAAILQNYSEKKIAVTADLEPVKLDIDSAMPCGLIINELVTNAIKHAFEGNDHPEISISFRTEEPVNGYRLEVGDNGRGLPQHFGDGKSGSLGYTLVTILVRQLHGEIRIEQTPGTRFIITFPRRSIAGGGPSAVI